MARQRGVIKIEGTLDDLTFYHSQDGSLIRNKTSLSGDRIANDPAFIRTRKNNAEFGAAAEAGKFLRDAIRAMMNDVSDSRVISRLTKQMSLIKNLDTTSARGKRNVGVAIALPAAQSLLKGFNFNIHGVLSSILFSPFTVDSATGIITISNFVPVNDVIFPEGATHVSISGHLQKWILFQEWAA